jgi:hypothetical protein
MTEIPVDAITERMSELGELLGRLAENRELVGELAAAAEEEDVPRFTAALQQGLGGFDLPPDKCHPYVQVFVLIVKPAKFVRHCVRNAVTISPSQGDEIAKAVATEADAERFLDLLRRLGIITCTWELEDQSQLLVAEKYVQGMCP